MFNLRKLKKTSVNSFIACCPAHHDEKPSLSIKYLSNGKVLFHCFAGCSYKKISEACGLRCDQRVNSKPAYVQPEPCETKLKAIKRKWDKAIPVSSGDLAYKYLYNRGISLTTIPSNLRFSDSIPCSTDSGLQYLPAMIAKVDSPQGELIQIHRTFLSQSGTKANIESPKRLMPSPYSGCLKGAAIRLFEPSEILGVAEGIETALACHLAAGLPVWSAIFASGLKNVIIPKTVKLVVIFADNDKSGIGREAAIQLGRRLSQEGKRVEIKIPPLEGQDWLDVFVS